MKSFAGFLRSLVVRWPNLSSWRSLTGFSGTATQFGYATTNQRGSSFIIPITHQTTTYITPGLVLWARYPGVGEMGRKMACGSWKHFSFFGHDGKIGKYAGRIGPKLCTSPGTFSLSLRLDSRWDFEQKFRGFCAFLPCLVGVWLDFGWRQPDFEGDCEEKMVLKRVRERPVGDIAHPGFLDMLVEK